MEAVRSFEPDLVHYQYPSLGYQPGAFHLVLPTLLRVSGIPVIQTWHEYQTQVRIYDIPNIILPGKRIAVRPNYMKEMSLTVRAVNIFKSFRLIRNASSIPTVVLNESERANLRRTIAPDEMRLIAYFGFVFPHKGVEDLFAVTDASSDHLLLICELDETDNYHASLLQLAKDRGNVSITGYVTPEKAAQLLAVADAVVFPLRRGGGNWNSSLHAATAQGTFVVSTTTGETGYDELHHIWFVPVGDLRAIREALNRYAGTRVKARSTGQSWDEVAEEHMKVYREVLKW